MQFGEQARARARGKMVCFRGGMQERPEIATTTVQWSSQFWSLRNAVLNNAFSCCKLALLAREPGGNARPKGGASLATLYHFAFEPLHPPLPSRMTECWKIEDERPAHRASKRPLMLATDHSADSDSTNGRVHCAARLSQNGAACK